MKEVCFECDVPIEMMEPTMKNPERRFECPKCREVYVGIEFSDEEDLRIN